MMYFCENWHKRLGRYFFCQIRQKAIIPNEEHLTNKTVHSYISSGRLSRFIRNVTQLFTVKSSLCLPAQKKKEDKVQKNKTKKKQTVKVTSMKEDFEVS